MRARHYCKMARMTLTESADVIQAKTSSEGEAAVPDQLARRIKLLDEMGLPSELCVKQLLMAGFPKEAIRPHFPDVPENTFADSLAPVGSGQRSPRSARQPQSVAAQGDAPAVPTASALLQRMELARSVPASSVPPTPASAPDAMSEGISFQYVPLIQCS